MSQTGASQFTPFFQSPTLPDTRAVSPRSSVSASALGHLNANRSPCAPPCKTLGLSPWWLALRKPLKKVPPGLPKHSNAATKASSESVQWPSCQHPGRPIFQVAVLRGDSHSQKGTQASSSSWTNLRNGKLEVVQAERGAAPPVTQAHTIALGLNVLWPTGSPHAPTPPGIGWIPRP